MLGMLNRVKAVQKRAAQWRSTPGTVVDVDAPLRVTDPLEFARDVLKITLWQKQQDIIQAVWNNPKVTVRSGHKIGKSTLAAVLALAWVQQDHARVIMTSSTSRQVKEILWMELTKIYSPVRQVLGGELFIDPATGLKFSDGRKIMGFTTDKPEKMAGFSGSKLLFIVDEASGVPEQIFEAIEGNLAGGGHLLMLSNPTQTVGTFYESHNTKRHFYVTFKVSSRETPNVVQGRDVIPGLATRAWVEEKILDWGEGSALMQVRVDGDFPTQGSRAVIPLAFLEAARERWADAPEGNSLDIGLDVARYGDDEIVAQPVRGLKSFAPLVMHSMDGVEIAGEVIHFVKRIVRPGERVRIKIDEIGVGSSVFDALNPKHNLEVAKLGWEIIAVNVGTSATAEGYSLLRDQLWFGMRDWLRDGGAIHDDAKLHAELVAPQYTFDARGKQKVWSKDEIKKIMGRSPDRADGLGLAIYTPPPVKILPRKPSTVREY